MPFRLFLSYVGCCAVLAAGVGAAHAQPARADARRVAYLSTLPQAEAAKRIGAIEKIAAGKLPGVNVEYRTYRYELPAGTRMASGEPDPAGIRRNEEIQARNDATIVQMLAWKPDVILAPGALPAKAAAKATQTIPIVFACKCNPLPDGFDLVKFPEKPERNLTGFTRYHLDMVEGDSRRRLNLHRKRIEYLKMAFPPDKPPRRIAAIYGDSYDEGKWRYEEAAQQLGVEWVPIRLTEASIGDLPALLRERRADAGLVLADTFLDKFSGRMARAAAASPMPVIFPWDEADLGAWMHYGTVVDIPEKAAEYVAEILKGRSVADYPVEFPRGTELAVNFRTAKAHGWTFPSQFLHVVDRAVE